MKLERILVATDFSQAATKAFEQSLLLARGGNVTLRLVHRLPAALPPLPAVMPAGVGAWSEVGPLLDDYNERLRAEATSQLEALAQRASDGVTIETSIDETLDASDAVTTETASWKPDLVALGTRGSRGIEKLVMGSVATKVLHHADAPVMLVRSDSELCGGDAPIGRILVPVDFSEHSQRALACARLLANRHGGSLHLLHAVELLRTPFSPGGLTSRIESEPGLREKHVEALTAMLGETQGEVSVVDGSSVAGAILAWREKLEASLVVMGSRGLTGLPHLLVGSVAEKVARFCEVPAIVVK